MSGISKKLMGTTAAAGGGFTAIEDVFSTYLYTGTGSALTITNGIDLAGEGGLVWIKSRTSTSSNWLMDTERGMNGVNAFLSSNTSNAAYAASSNGLTPNSNGFSHVSGNPDLNGSGTDFASWTFRKAPRFFDVVTYTGDGVDNRTIAHNLGADIGTCIIKRTDSTGNWMVWHRSLPDGENLRLQSADAQGGYNAFYEAAMTDTTFGVRTYTSNTNISGATYVAYLFAHDPLGPSEDGSDGLIACGSYTGNGSTDGPEINLGWEPQWVLIKNVDATPDWVVVDNMRGFTAGGNDAFLKPNTAESEFSATWITPLSTGFKPTTNSQTVNLSGNNYIYIAIRRGPMRAPESGTEVFATASRTTDTPSFAASFPVVDATLIKNVTSVSSPALYSRLTGNEMLQTASTAAEADNADFKQDYMNGVNFFNVETPSFRAWMFRRAPNFFDVVAYTTPTQTDTTVYHNLGVTPELAVVKRRNSTGSWFVTIPNDGTLILNDTAAKSSTLRFTDATATQFTAATGGSFSHAETGATWIAYLFATLAGVSKVGSYTGNGSSQTIDCGFTTGARFILIKRSSSFGSWYVFDAARGISSISNDPYLVLNNTDAESSYDLLDVHPSGFTIKQPWNEFNGNGDSFIFYAIA
jgi:hypothetical protein